MNLKKMIATTTAALTIFASMAAVPTADNTASILGSSAITVSAATTNRQYSTIAKEIKKFPQGKYWNSGNVDTYTSEPCKHHGNHNCDYYGSCGCTSFRGSIQCYGFARKICYDIYHQDPYDNHWPVDSNTKTLKAGDYIRNATDTHSMFVMAVKGNNVTIGECNYDGHCGIRWNYTITKSSLSGANIFHAPFEADSDLPPSTEKAPAFGTVWVEGDTYKFLSGAQMYSDNKGKTKAGTIPAGKGVVIQRFLTYNNGKDTIGVIDSKHYVLVRRNNVLLVSAHVTTNYKTGVNLRSAPTTDEGKSKVYGVVPNGTKLQVKACNDAWAQVTYKGKTGYVNLGICRG